MLCLNPLHAYLKLWCFTSQSITLKDSIYVSRETEINGTHNKISSSLASIHNHDVSNHSLLADPFSLSAIQHMVDIMRFECVQESKIIYHVQFW